LFTPEATPWSASSSELSVNAASGAVKVAVIGVQAPYRLATRQ
jgi:hypothetical protein